MRHPRRSLAILIAILGTGAGRVLADELIAPETALSLTSPGPDGSTVEWKVDEGAPVMLSSISMTDLGGQGLDLGDQQIDGNVLSVAQGAGFCLVVSSPAGEGAAKPTVTVDGDGRVRAQYSTPDNCLECTFHSGVSLNPQTFECTVPGGNGCGQCVVVPCWTDPDPFIEPEGGWNSPVIDGAKIAGAAFHELSLFGNAGTAGLRLTTPNVLVAAAHAQNGLDNSRRAAAFVGKSVEVLDAAGELHHVRFDGVGSTRFWAGSRVPVPTYIMTVSSEADPTPRPLCTGARNEAILFTGDRYDAATKSIIATGAGAESWINVACDGTAPAKLYLTRHTEASQQIRTTRSERQAMLKMITDDVYGDGVSFTVPGQPLLWKDAKGVTTFSTTAYDVEGLWNEHGAVCLNAPRRPETARAIEAHGTRPPRCTDAMLKTMTLGYVMSANPKPQP